MADQPARPRRHGLQLAAAATIGVAVGLVLADTAHVPAPDTRMLIAAVVAFGGGLINTVGAGGAILVFLGLTVACGLSPAAAVATSHLSTPAAFLAGRRARPVAEQVSLAQGPAIGIAAGGLVGALLLQLPWVPAQLAAAAPWLVLLATALLLVQPLLRRAGGRWGPWPWLTVPFATLAGIYGGAWGLSVGAVVLLAVLLTTHTTISAANRAKNDLCLVMAATSAVGYLLTALTQPDLVAWPLVPAMVAGAALGGWCGERWTHRLPAPAQWAVIAATAVTGAAYVLLAP